MVEKGICPLCGEKNNCAVVNHEDPSKCWCMTTNVPKGLLELVPVIQRKQSCICLSCVQKYKQVHHE